MVQYSEFLGLKGLVEGKEEERKGDELNPIMISIMYRYFWEIWCQTQVWPSLRENTSHISSMLINGDDSGKHNPIRFWEN